MISLLDKMAKRKTFMLKGKIYSLGVDQTGKTIKRGFIY